jgi:hypothetical protein
MSEEDSDYCVRLPYTENFEGKSFRYVWNTAPAYKWVIKNFKGNHYIKCVAYNENENFVGNNIYPILIGDHTWVDYDMAFDVKLEDKSYVLFAPFADSNSNPETVIDYGGRDPWTLYLDSDGCLFYQTFLGKCNLLYDFSESKNVFFKYEWNHISLYHNEEEILMTINGIDIGKVADYHGDYYGRVSFGGTVGVMIDNIEINA